MTPEYLEWIIKEYNIDYVVHGNDPCIVNGKDVYEDVKRLGKFQVEASFVMHFVSFYFVLSFHLAGLLCLYLSILK